MAGSSLIAIPNPAGSRDFRSGPKPAQQVWVGRAVSGVMASHALPNVGVGYLEGLFYLGASLLVGWSL